jgi:polyphosphate kinase
MGLIVPRAVDRNRRTRKTVTLEAQTTREERARAGSSSHSDEVDHLMAPKQAASDSIKMKRKDYEKELRKLQVELCHLQDWVKAEGARVIIVFEGRDAAGKGGTIKALTERVSPRVFRTVALPAPSDREKSQLFMQRYIERFPAAGEIVIFDRSWYNRAGVEYVMGFCTKRQHRRFLELCPQTEKYVVDSGIVLIKIWLEVNKEEQQRRFSARVDDPLRQWKLSPMDVESYGRWYAYSRARDMMLKATDSKHAPWHIVRSDNKRRARLNCISHILQTIPYKKVKRAKVKLPTRSDKGRYDDQATLKGRHFVQERF